MDINARIKWAPGMELTSKTLSALDDNFELRQMISVRTANGLRVGRIPGAAFKASGSFVKSSFEIERLQCTALLPSGMLISVDERVVVPVTPTKDTYTYLTVGFSTKMVEYEALDQTYLRPSYSFQFLSLKDIDNSRESLDKSVFPVMRFKIADGRISVDPAYIPPCLLLLTDPRLMQFIDTAVSKLENIVNHPNMEEGECKHILQRFIFTLKGYNKRFSMERYMQLMYEIANTIKFYIIAPNGGNDMPVKNWSQYDVERWLSWFETFLDQTVTVLDGVVLEDKTIDYDKLKDELRKEVYDMMMPEMVERIKKVQQIISDDLHQKLSDALHDYIDGTFRKQLHDTLQVELTDELRQPLYDGLYESLYNALYIPTVEEEDNFMPLI